MDMLTLIVIDDSSSSITRSTMASVIILILSLLIFLLFLLNLKINKTHNKPRLPPGPNGLPLIGNLHQLDGSTLHKSLWQLAQKYGPLMSLSLGFRPTLVVSSAKMARETLKAHDREFAGRPFFTGVHKIAYDGKDLGFAQYGAYWREMRKICVVHLFNSNRAHSFRPIREDEVSRMIEKTCKAAIASEPFSLTEAIASLTSTTICRVAFGKRYEDGGSEKSRFQELLSETEALFVAFFFSDYIPYMGWLDRLTGVIHRLQKNVKEFDVFYQEIINEHLDPTRPKPEREDILDVLLQIYKDGTFITLDHIKAILMDIFVAGTETSAASVIWAMSFLMKNPEAMRKAQEEIRSLVGNKGFVNEDDVHELPYLKAVVKETMRLQPIAPLLLPRETIEKCNICGYEIPAKTLVYVNAWAIGRDPEAWENPYKFYPDRFLGSSIDFKGQDYQLIPFGAGRRICPGLLIGISSVELSLANLLHKFDWEMPAGMEREDIDTDQTQPGLVMHTRYALCLVPKAHE